MKLLCSKQRSASVLNERFSRLPRTSVGGCWSAGPGIVEPMRYVEELHVTQANRLNPEAAHVDPDVTWSSTRLSRVIDANTLSLPPCEFSDHRDVTSVEPRTSSNRHLARSFMPWSWHYARTRRSCCGP